jgi:hypothetical protein
MLCMRRISSFLATTGHPLKYSVSSSPSPSPSPSPSSSSSLSRFALPRLQENNGSSSRDNDNKVTSNNNGERNHHRELRRKRDLEIGKTIDLISRDLPRVFGPPFEAANNSLARCSPNVSFIMQVTNSANSSSSESESESSSSLPSVKTFGLNGRTSLSLLVNGLTLSLRLLLDPKTSECIITHANFCDPSLLVNREKRGSDADCLRNDYLAFPCYSVRLRSDLKFKTHPNIPHLQQLPPKDAKINFYFDPVTGHVRVIKFEAVSSSWLREKIMSYFMGGRAVAM